MGSNDKSKESDRKHCIHHPHITKDGFFRIRFHDLTNNSKSWENKDIHFGVSEKSEKMLVKNRISSSGRIKEYGFKVTIHKKHSDGSSEYRKRKKQKKCSNKYGSYEKRERVERHSFRTHVHNGYDEVDRSEDRRRPCKVQTENTKIHSGSRVCVDSAKRRIHGSPRSHSYFHEGREKKKTKGRRE